MSVFGRLETIGSVTELPVGWTRTVTVDSQPPSDEDPLELVKRFQRTRGTFSCLGMGCRTTLLVLLVAIVAIFLVRKAVGQ